MKQFNILLTLTLAAFLFSCDSKPSFNDQIINDVTTKMGTGICDSIPKGSEITNVIIGEIVPIGETGLIDVSLEFDYEEAGENKHHQGALLYSKKGNVHYLEAIGGCEYGDK